MVMYSAYLSCVGMMHILQNSPLVPTDTVPVVSPVDGVHPILLGGGNASPRVAGAVCPSRRGDGSRVCRARPSPAKPVAPAICLPQAPASHAPRHWWEEASMAPLASCLLARPRHTVGYDQQTGCLSSHQSTGGAKYRSLWVQMHTNKGEKGFYLLVVVATLFYPFCAPLTKRYGT
jgi:hypothetical protein